MKKLVFLGNCQGRRLQVLYDEQFAPVTGDTTEFIGSFDELTPQKRAILAEADVILAQAIDSEHKIAVGKFETRAHIIEYPNVTGLFLWPYWEDAHICNHPLPDMQDGPLGQQFGDRWLNKRISAGAKPKNIVAEYEALDVPKAVNLDRLYELVMHRARERDRRTGFDIASIIESRFTDEALFLTPANLELGLFRPLAAGVYERLGVPSATVKTVLDALWRSPFPVLHHPIHPSVARHFGMKFIGPETRYSTLSGEALTFREWVARYVRFEWNEALFFSKRKIGGIRRFDSEAQAALGQLDAALKKSAQAASGESGRAHLLNMKGDKLGAIKAIRRAMTLDPSDPYIVATLAFYLCDQDDFTEAERLVREVTARWPDHPDGWRHLGIVLCRAGKPQDAVGPLRYAVGLNPRDVEAAQYLAAALTEAGSPGQALTVLTIATIMNPEAPDLFSDLAQRLSEMGDLDAALVSIRRAVALDPRHPGRLNHMAHILAARGDLVGASKAVREAIALEPGATELYDLLVDLLTRLGRDDEVAFLEKRRTLAREPGNTPLRHALVQELIRQGVLAEAEKLLVGAPSITPSDNALHAKLADLREGRGQLADAERSWRAAIAAAPDHADLRGSLALLLSRMRRLDEALTTIEDAVTLRPGNPHLLAKLSYILMERGNLAKARAAAEAGVALAPEMPGVHAALADICEREGNRAAALSGYRTAMGMDPGNPHYRRQAERLAAAEEPAVAAE